MENTLSPIDLMCKQLLHEVKVNEKRKPEERTTHTATVVGSERSGTYILVNGSAHKLEDSFVKLFTSRPELRSVVQNALDRMYKVEDK